MTVGIKQLLTVNSSWIDKTIKKLSKMKWATTDTSGIKTRSAILKHNSPEHPTWLNRFQTWSGPNATSQISVKVQKTILQYIKPDNLCWTSLARLAVLCLIFDASLEIELTSGNFLNFFFDQAELDAVVLLMSKWSHRKRAIPILWWNDFFLCSLEIRSEKE